MISENRLEEARELFDTQIQKRPDLLLPGSDIRHELYDIYDILSGNKQSRQEK